MHVYSIQTQTCQLTALSWTTYIIQAQATNLWIPEREENEGVHSNVSKDHTKPYPFGIHTFAYNVLVPEYNAILDSESRKMTRDA